MPQIINANKEKNIKKSINNESLTSANIENDHDL